MSKRQFGGHPVKANAQFNKFAGVQQSTDLSDSSEDPAIRKRASKHSHMV